MSCTETLPEITKIENNIWYAKIWGTAKLKSTKTNFVGGMKVRKEDAGVVMNYDKDKLIAGLEASARDLFMKEFIKKTGVTTFEFTSIEYKYEIYK